MNFTCITMGCCCLNSHSEHNLFLIPQLLQKDISSLSKECSDSLLKQYNEALDYAKNGVTRLDSLLHMPLPKEKFLSELDVIEKTVHIASKNLKTLSKAIKEKKEALDNLWGLALTNPKVIIIGGVLVISSVSGFAGSTVLSAVPTSLNAWRLGFGIPLTGIGSFLTLVLGIYSTAISVIHIEKTKLNEMDLEGKKQTEAFATFLTSFNELKQIQLVEKEKLENQLKEKQQELVEIKVENEQMKEEIHTLHHEIEKNKMKAQLEKEMHDILDVKIALCLEKYGALPKHSEKKSHTVFKTKDTQKKLLTNMFHDLPDMHPTKQTMYAYTKLSESETSHENLKHKESLKEKFTHFIKHRWQVVNHDLHEIFDHTLGHLLNIKKN